MNFFKKSYELTGNIDILCFGTIFYSFHETLQMQTVREQADRGKISTSGLRSFIPTVPDSSNDIKRLKIREFISWSICFGVVSGLTGMLMALKVGVTMETVTTALFFLSLAGLIYFIYRIVLLFKEPAQMDTITPHELN